VLALLIFIVLGVLVLIERELYVERSVEPIEVTLSFAPGRVATGEAAELLIRVENPGPLPVPWVVVEIDLPEGLHCDAADGRFLRARMGVPYRGGVVRHYPVRPARRGLYRLHRTHVTYTDPLGLATLDSRVWTPAELLAYPVPTEVALAGPTRAVIGEIERRSLYEDPTAFRGVRPYRSGDPMRRMHWPQTARTGQFMVREYATAVDARLHLCLNLATHTPHWSGIDRERLEAVISVGAGLAIAARAAALPTGLVVNGVAFEATPVTRLAPGASDRHLARTLDVLARLAPYPSQTVESLVDTAWRLPASDTLVFVSAGVPEAWRRSLPDLARRRDVILFVLAPADEPVPVLRHTRVVRLPLDPGRAGETRASGA